jgi:hypothetical protein
VSVQTQSIHLTGRDYDDALGSATARLTRWSQKSMEELQNDYQQRETEETGKACSSSELLDVWTYSMSGILGTRKHDLSKLDLLPSSGVGIQ